MRPVLNDEPQNGRCTTGTAAFFLHLLPPAPRRLQPIHPGAPS